MNGGFNGKFIYKWAIYTMAMFVPQDAPPSAQVYRPTDPRHPDIAELGTKRVQHSKK